MMKIPVDRVSYIGDVVRAMRKHSGIRQDDVADSVGVSHVYLRDLERGKETAQIGRALQVLVELGVRVPRVWRIYVPQAAYIVERFDRSTSPTAPELLRVHALDGCQMLNESAIFKYTSATFPKLLALIGLCGNKALARLEIFRGSCSIPWWAIRIAT